VTKNLLILESFGSLEAEKEKDKRFESQNNEFYVFGIIWDIKTIHSIDLKSKIKQRNPVNLREN